MCGFFLNGYLNEYEYSLTNEYSYYLFQPYFTVTGILCIKHFNGLPREFMQELNVALTMTYVSNPGVKGIFFFLFHLVQSLCSRPK